MRKQAETLNNLSCTSREQNQDAMQVFILRSFLFPVAVS